MGINFKNVGQGLKAFGQTVGNDFKKAGEALEKGDVKNAAVNAGDGFYDGAAASVGVAELLGARYPVNTYATKLDDHLTRGSRLSDEGIAQLQAQGYKGVVNLCLENDDDTPRAAALGMNSLHVGILDNTAPSEDQVKQFLDFATSPQNEPCYVHCEAGQGRTGVMSACYRMAVQGWTADQAIAEAKQMGMKLPDQLQFLAQFGADLQAGKIAGYPVQS